MSMQLESAHEVRAPPSDPRDPQSLIWEFVLYPSSDAYDFVDVLERLQIYFAADGDKWAYCLHDRDVLIASGELKKEHLHFMVYCSRRPRLSTLKSAFPELGQCIEKGKKTYRSMVRYLVHWNCSDPEKFNYSLESITANFDYMPFFQEESSDFKSAKIFAFICSPECRCYKDLVQFGVENNCFSEVRRGWSMWRDLMSKG